MSSYPHKLLVWLVFESHVCASFCSERDQGVGTDDVSVDVADHNLTTGAGKSQAYDQSGQAVVQSLLAVREVSQRRARITPSTVGKTIDAIQAWVEGERTKAKGEHANETEAAGYA